MSLFLVVALSLVLVACSGSITVNSDTKPAPRREAKPNRPGPKYVWVPGHWKKVKPRTWRWVPGHWKRR
jgi:hypothetical protein